MPKRLTIIQARMGSQRLPGKVLEHIGGKTVLEWVLHRVASADVGEYLIATGNSREDLAIVKLALSLGVNCVTGPEDDVLQRFYGAARCQPVRPDYVIRITADCPLLCPDLLNKLVDELDSVTNERGKVPDYVGMRGAPEGLSQEIISMEALTRSWKQARGPKNREHVVIFAIDQSRFSKCWIACPYSSSTKFSVDTPADLERLRNLYAASDRKLFDMLGRDIVELADALVAQ